MYCLRPWRAIRKDNDIDTMQLKNLLGLRVYLGQSRLMQPFVSDGADLQTNFKLFDSMFVKSAPLDFMTGHSCGIWTRSQNSLSILAKEKNFSGIENYFIIYEKVRTAPKNTDWMNFENFSNVMFENEFSPLP